MTSNERLILSICIVTFNQEKYIKKCLESILNQTIDYSYEIIVGDDCSTDNTRAIIDSIKQKHPNTIKTIYQAQNTSTMGNYLAVHRAARGKFVSHIDGDDWVNSEKFNKQIEYLEANPECPLVAHRMKLWTSDRNTGVTQSNPEKISLKALLSKHPLFLNSSIMYRSNMLSYIFLEDKFFIDFYVYVAAAKINSIGFINEILGNYRQHIGISKNRKLMPYIQQAIDQVDESLFPKKTINNFRAKQYFSYAIASLLSNDKTNFKLFFNEIKKLGKVSFKYRLLIPLENNNCVIYFIARTYKVLKYNLSKFNSLVIKCFLKK